MFGSDGPVQFIVRPVIASLPFRGPEFPGHAGPAHPSKPVHLTKSRFETLESNQIEPLMTRQVTHADSARVGFAELALPSWHTTRYQRVSRESYRLSRLLLPPVSLKHAQALYNQLTPHPYTVLETLHLPSHPPPHPLFGMKDKHRYRKAGSCPSPAYPLQYATTGCPLL